MVSILFYAIETAFEWDLFGSGEGNIEVSGKSRIDGMVMHASRWRDWRIKKYLW